MRATVLRRRGLLVALFICVVPSNHLRILLHRLINGYRISRSAKIGLGTILAVDQAQIGRASIGKLNRFQGPFSLIIGDEVVIDSLNTFDCGQFTLQRPPEETGYRRFCRIGNKAIIASGNTIDASGGFELGENSIIAGRGSQFWTHGGRWVIPRDWSIVIGRDCYIGSAVRFAPGAAIGNSSIVGMGSVVAGKFRDDHVAIAGVPAKVIKTNDYWRNAEGTGGAESPG